MDNIEFRPCVPRDVNEAVPLILASGPQAFNYVFKNAQVGPSDFLAYAFQRKGGEFSFDNHFALLLNQKLVGIGAVFSGKKASGFLLRDFLNIVRFYKMGAWTVLIKGLRTEQIIKPPKSKEICIAHLAVKEEERSKGLGRQLLQFLFGQVETNAASYFVLDVSEENPKAQALYERLGFEVSKQMLSTLKNEHGYVANHYRMELR